MTIDEEGIEQLVPRSPEELDYINRLVRQAMGFSELRGDEIEVVNSPFIQDKTTVNDVPWYQQPTMLQLAQNMVRYLLAGLGILLLYLLLLRPLLKRFTQYEQPTNAAPTTNRNGNLRAVVGDDDDLDELPIARRRRAENDAMGDEGDSDTGESFHWPQQRQNKGYTQALAKAKEVAQSNPRQVARILQNWMNEDDHV